MKTLTFALYWILGIWFCIYFVIGFAIYNFNPISMFRVFDTTGRAWLAAISEVVFFILLVIYCKDSRVLVQSGGHEIEKTIIDTINKRSRFADRYITVHKIDNANWHIKINAQGQYDPPTNMRDNNFDK